MSNLIGLSTISGLTLYGLQLLIRDCGDSTFVTVIFDDDGYPHVGCRYDEAPREGAWVLDCLIIRVADVLALRAKIFLSDDHDEALEEESERALEDEHLEELARLISQNEIA